jgi:hypothetical protein
VVSKNNKFWYHKFKKKIYMKLYTYKDLKNNPEKMKEFRKKLPWNFASYLYKKYELVAKEQGLDKPKYSLSTIRKVAKGERNNEAVLKDLIKIVNAREKVKDIQIRLDKGLGK